MTESNANTETTTKTEYQQKLMSSRGEPSKRALLCENTRVSKKIMTSQMMKL